MTPLPPEAETALSQSGQSLAALCQNKPTLTVFLRHLNCSFCRELLTILAKRRTEIEATGVQLALVHLGAEVDAAQVFACYGLEDLPRFANPQRGLYTAFGLKRGNLWEVLGWSVFVRRKVAKEYGLGMPLGDVFQLAGAFVLFQGQIVQAYRTKNAAEQPSLEGRYNRR